MIFNFQLHHLQLHPIVKKISFIFYILQYCYKYNEPPSDEYIQQILIPKCNGTYSLKYLIDCKLGIYFESYGRNDYYDENNNGKLIIFLNENKMDSDAIVEELENRVELSKQKLINFVVNDNDYNKIYEVIKFYYKYKQLPTPVAIKSLLLNLHLDKCECIQNVMKHELYSHIASECIKITKHNHKNKTINQWINELQKQTQIDDNEIKYIQQLFRRLLTFFYGLSCGMFYLI